MTTEEKKFLKNVQKTLDNEDASLDGSTLSRLTRARYAALEQSRSKKRLTLAGWSLAVTGSLLTAFILFPRQPDQVETLTTREQISLQLLVDEDFLEFYQEDIAFYEWLSETMAQENTDVIDLPAPPASRPLVGKRPGASSERRTHRVSRII